MSNRRSTRRLSGQSFYAECAPQLVKHRYTVVPLQPETKIPRAGGWPSRAGKMIQADVNLDVVKFGPDQSVGIVGDGGWTAFDCDITDPELVVKAARLLLGPLEVIPLCRVGNKPKCLFLAGPITGVPARVDLQKLMGARKRLPIKDRPGDAIEIMGQRGAQFAAFGIHPKTGRPYEWRGRSPLDVPKAKLPPIEFERLRDGLDSLIEEGLIERNPLRQTPRGTRRSETKRLGLPATFSLIAQRCPQMARVLETGGSDRDEEAWKSDLLLAAHCVDGEEWAHKLSQDYETYDPDETAMKFAQRLEAVANRVGPTRCETFEEIDPAPCQGCRWRGRVGSPLTLGRPRDPDQTDHLRSALKERMGKACRDYGREEGVVSTLGRIKDDQEALQLVLLSALGRGCEADWLIAATIEHFQGDTSGADAFVHDASSRMSENEGG